MDNYKIVHWNSNGLTNRLYELHAVILNNTIDIILLNETHLKSSTVIKISNYITYRNDIPTVRGSHVLRGTTIIVHRRIVHQHIQLQTNIQSTSIKIKSNNT